VASNRTMLLEDSNCAKRVNGPRRYRTGR
jgi:hypothetical protein